MQDEILSTQRKSSYLTVLEVADAFGVSNKTLYRLRNSNNGPPFFRVGQKTLYRIEDIERWITEQAKRGLQQTMQHGEQK